MKTKIEEEPAEDEENHDFCYGSSNQQAKLLSDCKENNNSSPLRV